MSILAGLQDTTIQQTATMLINPKTRDFVYNELLSHLDQSTYVYHIYIHSVL